MAVGGRDAEVAADGEKLALEAARHTWHCMHWQPYAQVAREVA